MYVFSRHRGRKGGTNSSSFLKNKDLVFEEVNAMAADDLTTQMPGINMYWHTVKNSGPNSSPTQILIIVVKAIDASCFQKYGQDINNNS